MRVEISIRKLSSAFCISLIVGGFLLCIIFFFDDLGDILMSRMRNSFKLF